MCAEAKQIDLVDYLASLGHRPQKVRNQDYWYLSPLREEKTPSFKVNRQLNVWYDHGTGKGGDLIDFGTLYFGCSVSDLLDRLSHHQPAPSLSLHPPTHASRQHSGPASFAGERKDASGSRIVILDARPLAEPSLLEYLQKRCIPLEIATRFCKEVDFLLYGEKRTVIGFRNNAGGYELRSGNFKGSSSPKDVTFIDNHAGEITVFEGFFSFLSFQTINNNQQDTVSNCLILNSLSFFEKSRPLMEQHGKVHLVLDRDAAGIHHTQKTLQWDRDKYQDRSDFYHGHKDLNEWLVHHHHSQKEPQRLRRRP
ncbi:toprim domain-containing protein [Chitinophaga japonensis]